LALLLTKVLGKKLHFIIYVWHWHPYYYYNKHYLLYVFVIAALIQWIINLFEFIECILP
jgi:hypothetical protein